MTEETPFPYNFAGLCARETSIVREQIRDKLKALAPYVDDKKMSEAISALKELDGALGEHFYIEGKKLKEIMEQRG